MSTRNFTHNSNFIFTTNLFNDENVSYYIQEANLPGLSFSHIQVSRQSTSMNFQADTLTYNDLTLNFIIDEELSVWKNIVSKMQKMRDVYSGEGELIEKSGYLEIHDDNSNIILKVEFINLIIESIDDMQYSTNTEDEIITCSINLKYDYYNILD
jgi:hypothetical protein